MTLHLHPLHTATTPGLAMLDLATLPPTGLHLWCAHGASVRGELPPRWRLLCLPLQGEVRLQTPAADWIVGVGDAELWSGGALRCAATASTRWVGLAGPEAAWNACLPLHTDGEVTALLPWDGTATRALRCAALRLLRAARADASSVATALRLRALGAELLDLQRDLHARAVRCSGRTAQRRIQTLLRLLRVRQLIGRHPDGRFDLAQLARCASYSPCHLIRIYREVFDETPFEYATRLRDQRAWRLVRDTELPVGAITQALGFESQSAFCRAFKSSFGITATQARREAVPA